MGNWANSTSRRVAEGLPDCRETFAPEAEGTELEGSDEEGPPEDLEGPGTKF